MPLRPIELADLFLIVVMLVAVAWGVRLRIEPERYNPDSLLHRQLYLWYVGWFGKKLDESWLLEKEEVRKAGLVITLLGGIVLIFAILSFFLPQAK